MPIESVESRRLYRQIADQINRLIDSGSVYVDARRVDKYVDAMQDLKPDYVTYTPYFAVNGNQWQPSNDALASADALLAAIQAVA